MAYYTNSTSNTLVSGTDYADYITNYSASNNASILGFAGNDSIYNYGKNVVIYGGDGNDIIYGFENNDLLQITNAFSASYNQSKKELYFKVGSTAKAIILKDFTVTTLHVNGTDYKISDTKLVRK